MLLKFHSGQQLVKAETPAPGHRIRTWQHLLPCCAKVAATVVAFSRQAGGLSTGQPYQVHSHRQ